MTTLGEALRLTLLVGAAHAAATPAQREALRRIKPLLEQYRVDGDETQIRARLRDVMGVDWVPPEEWRLR